MNEARKAPAPSWTNGTGRQVRGFRSSVDGSVQPLGLVFPENTSTSQTRVPLYVWLHGRGDKTTDLHFICDRLDKDGQITPDNAIVLHPFGRQCIGYKSAGETDVMEAIEFVCQMYPVDRNKIVLMGFSMGGAGVWHLAAHYGERFVAASPGAGFAETARYQRLKPAQYPPRYEQLLWSIYDVPGYTRNLFNLPIVAYSGELDRQIQAARVMEEAFQAEGRKLTHLIGPGMGHKYHPETLQEILSQMAHAAATGKPSAPNEIFLQSPHPRYATRNWLTIDGAVQQYADTRIDATRTSESTWSLQTKNVSRCIVDCTAPGSPTVKLSIDGQSLSLTRNQINLFSRDEDQHWESTNQFPSLRKRPKMSGPIDDAFIDPFLVVVPSGESQHAEIDRWVKCELAFFQLRWRQLFRGQLRIKRAQDVTAQDLREFHLVLWGTPSSNPLIRKILNPDLAPRLPIRWGTERIVANGTSYDSAHHIPLLIFPNPLATDRYVVFNSGPTFRPAHDRTNSLQNPHLPDWAIVSIDQAPSDASPGQVVRTGFFDPFWRWDNDLVW